MKRRIEFGFTVTILTAFALVFLVSIGLVVIGYRHAGGRAALETAEYSLALAAGTAAANTRSAVSPVIALAAELPEFAPLTQTVDPAGRDTTALLAVLRINPAIHVVSVGLADGTLRQVLRLEGQRWLPPVTAGDARFALRESRPDIEQETWYLFGEVTTRVSVPRSTMPAPDPRRAQWFLQADGDGVRVSNLYDLPLLDRPGLSVSRRIPGTTSVFALDVTLDSLARLLTRQRPSDNGVVFLFTEDGILLAHQKPELALTRLDHGRSTWTTLAASSDPILRRIWAAYAQGQLRPEQTREIADEHGALLVRLATVGELVEPPMLVAVYAPVSDFTGVVANAVRDGTMLAAAALVFGLSAIGVLAWRIARPLGMLEREAGAIRRLELAAPVIVGSRITEIARLSEAMDGMKSALRLFGLYVPRGLVGQLMRQGAAARVGGQKRHLSIMFTDVANFTTLAEGLEPEELMHITSEYFQAITDELLRNDATIDKYIGDAVMSLWNAPADDPHHALNACRAALASRDLTDRLCDEFAARGWPRLMTRFGIHSGDAVVGNVGSTDRVSYTAIGAMVNLASRLEGMNKLYDTRILISEQTRLEAGPEVLTRPVDLVLAKGAKTAVEVHELLGLAGKPVRTCRWGEGSHAAWMHMMAAYRHGQMDVAAEALLKAGDPREDGLIALYADRIAELRAAPLPADWSPINKLSSK